MELALPRSEPPKTKDLPDRLSAPLPSEIRILLAEDNPINEKVVCAMLRRQCWSVTMAVNGVQACTCFQAGSFDFVLMDVQMPDMDGLEAARRIRADEQRRGLVRTPILALTAHASKAHCDQCLAHGMDTVVTKPVNLTTLLSAIAAAMENRLEPLRSSGH